jgi:chromosome segregation ATPase
MDTTEIEKKSLEAHVELCAERYRHLELQLDSANSAINRLKEMTEEVHAMMHKIVDNRNNQLINWGLGSIGFLLATVGWLLSHYVFK